MVEQVAYKGGYMAVKERINGVDITTLKEISDEVRKHPTAARCEFRASNTWIDGGHNQTRIQGYYAAGQEQKTRPKPFTLEADEPPALMGTDKAPNPVEYVLAALASCITTSIVYHLSMKGYRVHAISSEMKGEIDLQGFLGINHSVPKGYKKIEASFKIKTDAPKATIEEAYKLSPTYSMLSKGTPVEVKLHLT